MHLRLHGEQIPEALCEVVAAITDHARLRHAELTHDESSHIVRLPITRFPLTKQRRVLGNVHDWHGPIRATVTVRNVVACELVDHTTPDLGDEVQLLFGIRVRGKEISACSAEEDRGQTCFSVTVEVGELDLEITDVAGKSTRDGA